MSFGQAFRMALKSILAKKGRSVLTMLGIVIGVAAVIVLVSLQTAQVDQWEQSMKLWYGDNALTLNYYNNPQYDLMPTIRRLCEKADGRVIAIAPNDNNQANLRYKARLVSDASYKLTNEDYIVCFRNEIAKGRNLTRVDVEKRVRAAVITDYIASTMFGFRNPIGETLQINGHTFTVVGVLEPLGLANADMRRWQENFVLIPYTFSREVAKSLSPRSFSIKTETPATLNEAADILTPLVQAEFNGMAYLDNPSRWTDDSQKQREQQALMLGGIAAISLLVGGIGIMNIMMVTVAERRREIGIRKAIGAQRSSIIIQFLIESALLSAIGGLIGVAIGTLITIVMGRLTIGGLILPEFTIVLIGFLFSLAMGVGFGVYPAAKASALQPVIALRNE